MSDGFIIIDRRKNPAAKSLSNRQRFVERAKNAIRESAKKALGNRSINDHSDTNISVPIDGVDEPRFRHDPEMGDYDYVLPGNDEYIVGDLIQKPRQQKSSRGNGGNGGDGGGDDFEFALSYDEYLDVIFDDLELPDLIKQTEKNAVAFVNRRAGYTNAGMPSNLNARKTAIAGIGRRMALRVPKLKQIEELEAELIELKAVLSSIIDEVAATIQRAKITELEDEITTLQAKVKSIAFLDDVDMRYNNFVKQPRPITQAVMFCVMDVSFSMGEREKIIAKKFFVLLHLFLLRRYENIDVVFVRHHDQASECDETTFFTDRSGGGTVVSSAYDKVKEIMAARYNSEDWNIYLAQASDGDNQGSDNLRVNKILSEELLPAVQHFTYIEIEDEGRRSMFAGMFGGGGGGSSSLWQTIEPLTKVFDNISCAQINDEREVVKVFRKLFKKEAA
jgi:uncharacterized sporulation protein YeaH/YhbH (DUF444 family)